MTTSPDSVPRTGRFLKVSMYASLLLTLTLTACAPVAPSSAPEPSRVKATPAPEVVVETPAPADLDKEGFASVTEETYRESPEILKSQPLGTWRVSTDVPYDLPAGFIYPQGSWIFGENVPPFINGDGNKSAGLAFVGDNATYHALIESYKAAGWTAEVQDAGDRWAAVLETRGYRLILTTAHDDKQASLNLDPVIYYTVVHLNQAGK